jgi:hypothetical protein
MGCGSGLSVFISNLRGWPGNLFGDIRLAGGKARRYDREAARGIETYDWFGCLEAFALEKRTDALAQLARGGINHPRWNLFASDFE